MFDRRTEKYPAAVRDSMIRKKDFGEVCLGYGEETARAEAGRCLGCPNKPCMEGCPVGVPIPEFIALVREGKYEEAYRAIAGVSSLPAVCGRVCPQERQCEGKCTRGIKGEPVAIGMLERFCADFHAAHGEEEKPVPSNGRRVAVVGSGPAGLSCAGELARRGYSVDVFEALHRFGGVLVYGIPEFRLPKSIVEREIAGLSARGVRFEKNVVVGRSVDAAELAEEYDAVFLGTGAGLPRFAGIKGENARGVFSANEYLTRCNLMKAYEQDGETPIYRARRVAVVGGGNVAMDAARCAVRLGAEKVTVVYRRSEEELPARKEEVAHAREEGVEFLFLASPEEVLTENGDAVGLKCVRMELGEPDASGRRRPEPVADSSFTVGADCVIMALGTFPNPLIARTAEGPATGSRGEILADACGATSLEGVYAGGDAVTGAATVILAMGAGKRAAEAIDGYLRDK